MQPAPASLPILSCLGARWNFTSQHWREGAALAQSTGLPGVVASILAARGYPTVSLATTFLNPRLDALPDPLTLKSMDVAIARLIAALEASEPLAIFGDYDVDGTCATALLTRYLRALGANPVLYIPDRLTEGYGPTPEAMHKIARLGTKLLITVDTGTAAHAALAEAKTLGMDVIVTDHHLPHGDLPEAVAIINPHRADDTSALQSFCGSGIAFYLVMGLNRALRAKGFFNDSRPEPKLTSYLDLVALATVADVMPLTGLNRILVARGMQQMATWQHRGLAALAGVAGVKDDVTATGMAFSLAPRLNAAGRIESAQTALNLLLADEEAAAYPLAQQLNTLNIQRQALEKSILIEARQQAEQLMQDDTLVLVLHAPHWHPGVAGIVAARIKEAFNRPTFILGQDANGHLKGSGRSITGLNLGAAVHAASETLLSGGGHAAAAGVTLLPANLAAFRRELNDALWVQLNARQEDAHLPLTHRLAPHLTLEATVTPGGLTSMLAQTLQQLAPFGMGNPEPVLAVTNTRIASYKAVGATQEHLRLSLADASGARADAICFGAMTNPLGKLLTQTGGRAITVAATLKPRTFNGKPMLDIHVKDAHPDFTPPAL